MQTEDSVQVQSVLLTFIIGHVPQRRVAGVSLTLTLIKASFNPALYKKDQRSALRNDFKKLKNDK